MTHIEKCVYFRKKQNGYEGAIKVYADPTPKSACTAMYVSGIIRVYNEDAWKDADNLKAELLAENGIKEGAKIL